MSDRMAEIRPLEAADLPAVTALFEANLPAWTLKGRLSEFLQATLLDDPWRDDELPSLVATDGGEVVGFIACQIRRFRFGDRDLRAVCASHLIVDPDHRSGAVGALMFRRMLTGGQDFTYSDTANDEVARMVRAFGGDLDHTRACDWMFLLRPGRWLGRLGTGVLTRRNLGRDVPVGALPFKSLRPGSGRRAVPAPDPEVRVEEADEAAVIEHLDEIGAGYRLRPRYDAGFLEFLLRQLTAQIGDPVHRLVWRGDRAVGWYLYVPLTPAVHRVLALEAAEREGEAVLSAMLEQSRERGVAAVCGRLEPHLTRSLEPHLPLLGFARRPWTHTREAEFSVALASSAGLLTQLDGEWFIP
jgi:hypothetical protein